MCCPGYDVTIVAFGRMVTEAETAAKQLAEENISVEIIDPRTLQPLDNPFGARLLKTPRNVFPCGLTGAGAGNETVPPGSSVGR